MIDARSLSFPTLKCFAGTIAKAREINGATKINWFHPWKPFSRSRPSWGFERDQRTMKNEWNFKFKIEIGMKLFMISFLSRRFILERGLSFFISNYFPCLGKLFGAALRPSSGCFLNENRLGELRGLWDSWQVDDENDSRKPCVEIFPRSRIWALANEFPLRRKHFLNIKWRSRKFTDVTRAHPPQSDKGSRHDKRTTRKGNEFSMNLFPKDISFLWKPNVVLGRENISTIPRPMLLIIYVLSNE